MLFNIIIAFTLLLPLELLLEDIIEIERVRELSHLSIDIADQDPYLESFTKILTSITQAVASQINLFDASTQYTIGATNAPTQPIDKDTTFCQYTLGEAKPLEIKKLSGDSRFYAHFAVVNEPYIEYYFGAPIITSNNVPIGTVCVMHTEEIELSESQRESIVLIAKQVATYLEKKNELVDQKKKILEQQSSIKKINHDLKGPISGIIGSISMIDKSHLDEQASEMLGLIKASCNNLIEYVNTTLSEVIDEEQKNDFPTSTEMIKKLTSIYQPQAESKQVTLKFQDHLIEGEHILPLTSGELLNIIGNVISNAIKYSYSDTDVLVEFSHCDDESNMNTESNIQVRVSDHGVGMSQEKIEAINQMNYTETSSGTNGEQGHGIGLAEALRVLTENKGTFNVNSKEREGTEFILYMPNI